MHTFCQLQSTSGTKGWIWPSCSSNFVNVCGNCWIWTPEVYFFINTILTVGYAKCEPNLARIFGVHEHVGNSQATVLW